MFVVGGPEDCVNIYMMSYDMDLTISKIMLLTTTTMIMIMIMMVMMMMMMMMMIMMTMMVVVMEVGTRCSSPPSCFISSALARVSERAFESRR